MKIKKQIPFIWLGPIITLMIMMAIYALSGLYPFGNLTTAVGDGMAQYVPFLADFVEKIKEGGSLFFTWHAGRGTNFWSTISYYLASPFNLIGLFFDKENIADAFSLITLLKPAFASLTFSIFLKGIYKKNDASLAIFSVLWGFSAFIIGAIFFTTWIDAIIYFPLVVLSLHGMMNGKSAWKYSLSLGVAIASNFYIGWIICIFCVIYFVYSLISDDDVVYEGITTSSEKNDIEEDDEESLNIFDIFKHSYLLGSCFKFALSSILAGTISAVFTVPAFVSLQSTVKGAVSIRESQLNFTDFWAALASHIFPANDIYITYNTYDYIFCFVGLMSLILSVAFFFVKGISTKKKVGNLFLLVVMWFSYAVHSISYIWHGFGEPAGLAYRFSFVYSFILLKIAYEVFINIKQTSSIGILFGSAISFGCVAGLYFSPTLSYYFFSWETVIYIVTFIVVFTVLLMLKKNDKMPKAITWLILLAIVIEVFTFNKNSINVKNVDGIFKEQSAIKETSEMLNDGEYLTFAANSKDFDEMLMYGLLFGYNSTELYSSMADGHYTLALSEMGSYGNRMNAQNGAQEQTPIYNLLFPSRYYLDGTGRLSESWYRSKINQDETYTLFENKYTMPFMYVASFDIENYEPFGFFSVADNQNDAFKHITGLDKDAVTKNMSTNFEYQNCKYISNTDRISETESTDSSVHSSHDGHNHSVSSSDYEGLHQYFEDSLLRVSYELIDKTKPAFVNFDSIAQDDGLMYLYVDTSEFTDLYVTVNGIENYYEIVSMGETRTYEIGEVKKDDVINIRIGGHKTKDTGSGDLYVNKASAFSVITYTVNKDVFEEGFNKLDAMSDTEILEFEDTYVKAKLTSYEDGALYIPTAYDEGWTILIDGVEKPLYEHESHILMTGISAGEHIVEMKYCPVGFVPGAIITGVSIAILVAWAVIATKRCKKEEECATIDETSVNEE